MNEEKETEEEKKARKKKEGEEAYQQEMFQYLLGRCEGLKEKQGIDVESRAAEDYRVSVTFPRKFKTRVQALRFAEKVAELLKDLE